MLVSTSFRTNSVNVTVPLTPCPPLAPVQPTNLECHLLERFLPGRCEDLSRVLPGELWENPGGSSWSQSPRLLDGETLEAAAELEHETAQEKRAGLVAMQVSTAPPRGALIGASQPPARLRLSRNRGGFCDSHSLVGRAPARLAPTQAPGEGGSRWASLGPVPI